MHGLSSEIATRFSCVASTLTLASSLSVGSHPNETLTHNFRFTPPLTSHDALAEAQGALYFRDQSKEELIDTYMNGPRTLSTERMSYLVVSSPSFSPTSTILTPQAGGTQQEQEADKSYQTYHLFMVAPHFTGDGTSLHQATHDLLALLASPSSEDEIIAELDLADWAARLPASWESRCTQYDNSHDADPNTNTTSNTNTNTGADDDKDKGVPRGRFVRVAARVHAVCAKAREVGGHAFARLPTPASSSSKPTQTHRTILLERVYTPSETRAVLAHCRAHGVTVNHALEAAIPTNSRMINDRMLYTAINLRPHLAPVPPRFVNEKRREETYWFLALTYFTLVLPAFPPPLVGSSSPSLSTNTNTNTPKTTFWLRAQSAKQQTRRTVQSPLLVHRALEMAEEREARARGVPRRDIGIAELMRPMPAGTENPSVADAGPTPKPPPSTALLGLSLIGNLDATYVRSAYPAFELESVTTASRQKRAGALLLVHTFAGRLWVQFFFDEWGFVRRRKGGGGDGEDGDGQKEDTDVEVFWDEVGRAVTEFLID
ncbi:hypothetical protein DXG03_006782 [Asterophora parasitica]|uniref:Uncharacterized protein n=1 Tax=Asterophora parasitica TaxID=117018 RepID=A0A9P7G7X3_9AGAR|nr:hypothetical protein DXG03_006782 [Asterophora parasitica]